MLFGTGDLELDEFFISTGIKHQSQPIQIRIELSIHEPVDIADHHVFQKVGDPVLIFRFIQTARLYIKPYTKTMQMAAGIGIDFNLIIGNNFLLHLFSTLQICCPAFLIQIPAAAV